VPTEAGKEFVEVALAEPKETLVGIRRGSEQAKREESRPM
jgi:hypothetical protein